MFQWRASFFFLNVPILTDWHFDKIQWISNGKKIRLTKYTRPLSSTRITVKSRGKFLDAESQVLHSPWISNYPDQRLGSGSHWTQAAHTPRPLSRAHTCSGSSQRPLLSPTSHTRVQWGQRRYAICLRTLCWATGRSGIQTWVYLPEVWAGLGAVGSTQTEGTQLAVSLLCNSVSSHR